MRIAIPRHVALLLLALGMSTLATRTARACQMCVEDKIAATYDWPVVTAAKRQGHTVVFTAIKGRVPPEDKAVARRLTEMVAAVRGVDAGSVRVSLSPPALSFAADLRRRSAERLLRAANDRLRAMNLTLTVVRIGAPAGGSPVSVRAP